MDTAVHVCGREFTPALIQHLAEMIVAEPDIRRHTLAREVCMHLDWYSRRGDPALSSARVALRKLEGRGLLELPALRTDLRGPHRLRASGRSLPPVSKVPGRVDQVRGLHLHLISGQDDPLHPYMCFEWGGGLEGGAAAPPPIIHVETPSGMTNRMDTMRPKLQIRLRTAHRPVTNIAPDRVNGLRRLSNGTKRFG